MGEHANPEEIREAIYKLTREDTGRLQKYAEYRVRPLAGRINDRTYEDLLQEAIVKTLTGERCWNRSVKFSVHLRRVVESISSHWYREAAQHPLISVDNDKKPLDLRSGALDPERNYMAEELVKRAEELVKGIEDLFKDDPLVSQIIKLLRQGKTGPEIKKQLSISQTDFETGMKRMRRKLANYFKNSKRYGCD